MKRAERSHVIVTGGAQGIGRIVTGQLIENGYNVSIFDIDGEAMEELKHVFNNKYCQYFVTDVSNEVSVKSCIRAAVKHFGPIYGLVNNAVCAIFKPMEELSLNEWNTALGTNLTGTFLCCKHAASNLKETHGSIVNMSSTRAFQSEPNTESYSASKGGINALTHAMAMSLGPNVRVNSISPGWIDVSAVRKKSNAIQEKISPEDHAQHPAGRVGNGLDIARMVLFLLNKENSFITGQNFVVDGGMTKKMIYI
ncbi:MAG: SDR family oxidoreductase [Dysgonamonadaceae bacterium]